MSKIQGAENTTIYPTHPISITSRASSTSYNRNEIPMPISSRTQYQGVTLKALIPCKKSSHLKTQVCREVPKRKSRPRLITLSTSDGRWHGKWNCDYIFSLQELQVHDLSDIDLHKDADVFINLSIQKHAGLGMSVEGRIITCFTMRCCNCCSPYLREINSTFKVWILPSTKPSVRDSSSQQLPDIGGDDPSVIYVKPGSEADLDSLIQDTIRLATSVKETCSESCEKSEPKLHHFGTRNVASVERRWSKLLELKKNY